MGLQRVPSRDFKAGDIEKASSKSIAFFLSLFIVLSENAHMPGMVDLLLA